MKLKNIFITALAAGFLTACVAEDINDGSSSSKVIEGLDTSISLKLNVAGTVDTKAYFGEGGDAGKYELANPDELYVSKVAVAIFKKDDNGKPTDRVGFGYTGTPAKTGLHGTLPETQDTLAYKVENIMAKTGNVRIVVIANSKLTETELKSYLDYDDLKTAVESNLTTGGEATATFLPRELVKVGELDHPLSTTNNKDIIVPMTQLAARINLRFNVDELLQKKGEPYYKSSYNGVEYTDAQMRAWAPNSFPSNAGISDNCNHDNFQIDGKIIRKFSSGTKLLHLANYKVQLIQPYIQWKYEISNLSIYNVETKSNIIIDGINPESNSLKSLEFNNDADLFTFYSYEKNVNTQNPLKITAEGDLIQTQVDSIYSWTGDFHIFWLKKSSTGELGTPDKYENGVPVYILEPGTGGTGYFWIAPFNVSELKKETVGQGQIVGAPEVSNLNYTAIINPKKEMEGCNTDGVIHGNNYDVLGKINLKTKGVNFTTQVVPWSAQYVEIGAEIMDVHYLFVKETNVVMSNVADYWVDYKSDSPLTYASFSNKTASFIEYYKDGNTVKSRNATVAASQYTFTIENGKIKIHSNIPTNYFPRTLSFDVTNTAGLTQHVDITQYPPQYLTAVTSVGGGPVTGNDSPQLSSNPNIFTINIIASEGLKVGIPTDPSVNYKTLIANSNYKTLTSEEANELISPKFLIASRQAVVTGSRYSSSTAAARCKVYWETTDPSKTEANATYPPGTWRMPTIAELAFLYKMQTTQGALVGILFNNDGQYWTARQDTNVTPNRSWYFDFGAGDRGSVSGLTTILSNSQGGVRCVRDLY